jgi:hypothetical protein
MKNKMNFNWHNYYFNLKYETQLTESLINKAIDNWTTKTQSKVAGWTESNHVIVLFRIATPSNTYKTIGTLQALNIEDIQYYKNYIINRLASANSGYADLELTKIIFSYGVRSGKAPANLMSDASLNADKIIFQNYRHFKLPNSLNPLAYGSVISSSPYGSIEDDGYQATLYIMQSHLGNVYHIIAKEVGDEIINSVSVFIKGMLMMSYTDKSIIDEVNGKFMRIIGKNHYIFDENGNLELFYVEKPTKYIAGVPYGTNTTQN